MCVNKIIDFLCNSFEKRIPKLILIIILLTVMFRISSEVSEELEEKYPKIELDITPENTSITGTINETVKCNFTDEIKLNLVDKINEGTKYIIRLRWDSKADYQFIRVSFNNQGFKKIYEREKEFGPFEYKLGEDVFKLQKCTKKNASSFKKEDIDYAVNVFKFNKWAWRVVFITIFVLLGEFCRLIHFFLSKLCSSKKK